MRVLRASKSPSAIPVQAVPLLCRRQRLGEGPGICVQPQGKQQAVGQKQQRRRNHVHRPFPSTL